MMKKVKKGSALVVAFALVLSALVIPKTYAALAVETGRTCTLELNVAKNVSTGDIVFAELNELPVAVNLYKVATIDVSGNYEETVGFESLNLESVNSETTAEIWEAQALAAKALIAEDTEASKMVYLNNGSVTTTGLETGMYLVVPEDIKSDYYAYTFKPYLISLPNNYYYSADNDAWVYNLVGENAIGLKPEATDLYGDLVIEKDLKSFNATVGGAAFVFQVEAVKDYTAVGGEEDVKVYSDVVSITFDEAGKKQVVIDDIPAGAVVTVTEVYSGGSYSVVGDDTIQTEIIADDITDDNGEPHVAGVAFENVYNDKLNGGSGVVNHFEEGEKGWIWSKSDDSTN